MTQETPEMIMVEIEDEHGEVSEVTFGGILATFCHECYEAKDLTVSVDVDLYRCPQAKGIDVFTGYVRIYVTMGQQTSVYRDGFFAQPFRSIAREMARLDAARALYKIDGMAGTDIGAGHLFQSMIAWQRLVDQTDRVRRVYRHALMALAQQYHDKLFDESLNRGHQHTDPS